MVSHSDLQRLSARLLLAVLTLSCCWFAMQAIHEMGHVLAALVTGGRIQKVVLHPLTISSTTVSPNPYPAWVAWSGPLFGCALPILFVGLFDAPPKPALSKIATTPTQVELVEPASAVRVWRELTQFFAGFCLVVNGVYLAFGGPMLMGDGREMIRSGSPTSLVIAVGMLAAISGLLIWHRLGTISGFFERPMENCRHHIVSLAILLSVILVIELVFSPR